LLITSFRQVIVDIKFTDNEHFFYWRIYNRATGEIPEIRSPEERYPYCRWGMDAHRCSTCGSSCS